MNHLQQALEELNEKLAESLNIAIEAKTSVENLLNSFKDEKLEKQENIEREVDQAVEENQLTNLQ